MDTLINGLETPFIHNTIICRTEREDNVTTIVFNDRYID